MKYFFLCLLLVLAGCSSNRTGSTVRDEFTRVDSTQVFVNRLVSSDIIEFSVEVNGLAQVPVTQAELNEEGVATLPLVGDVELSGLTRAQAKAEMEEVYSKLYVHRPLISLSVVYNDEADAWGYVTVLGRVESPGRVAVSSSEGIHLSEALKLADGFAIGAKRDAIRITRVDETGEKMQCTVDFKHMADHGDAESDLLLRAGDMVHVPERLF
jgi:protein involved in polysaccharide export with SLBB domain